MTLEDVPAERPLLGRDVLLEGLIWDVRRDTVDLGHGGVVRRDYLRTTGAAAVLALDEGDRVLLQRQYRHPVAAELWELPAGLLDVPGEEPVVTAQRELAEEADLTAARWWHLVDYLASPGSTDEHVRVFLARDLRPVPEHERHTRTGEEADLTPAWVPLDDAVDAVLARRVRNPSAVVGVLAAAASRARGWTGLTPA